MPWNRSGDTGSTYPALMKVAGLRDSDERSINEVAGFVWRLSNLSSAHLTDYIVDIGTVQMIGGANVKQLVALCKRTGLLTKIRIDGIEHHRIIDDPDFIHMRLRAEILWDRQQKADRENVHLTKAIRFRDGDQCRWCGTFVQWMGRPSARSATFDHLNPGEPGTVATVVIACRSCNSSWRDIHNIDRIEHLRPEPDPPFYSADTAKFLNRNGYTVEPTEAPDDERPGRQPDTAKRKKRTTTAPRQRPASQADTASTTPAGDSDPASAGPRAPADESASGRPPPPSTESELSQDIGTSSVGSGRVGSGSASGSTSERPVTRTRKRSRRGADPQRHS